MELTDILSVFSLIHWFSDFRKFFKRISFHFIIFFLLLLLGFTYFFYFDFNEEDCFFSYIWFFFEQGLLEETWSLFVWSEDELK